MSPHNPAPLMVPRHPQVFAEVSCQHGDYVQDVAFDFYGTRVATASSDKKIKIWDRDASGHWNDYPTYEWRHHRGPVRKLAWSHPCFGSLLASGSDDKYVYVWQEPSGGRGDAHHAAGKTRETPWKGIYHSNDHLAAVCTLSTWRDMNRKGLPWSLRGDDVQGAEGEGVARGPLVVCTVPFGGSANGDWGTEWGKSTWAALPIDLQLMRLSVS